MIEIGKIIRGESHLIYWVHVNNSIETDPHPTPEDCSFGTFVRIEDAMSKKTIIGVIMDTMLIDRDALHAGPRLTPDTSSIGILYPDFIDERIKVVKIMLIGFLNDKIISHNFPDITPNLGDPVIKMEKKEVIAFHTVEKKFQIGYYSSVVSFSTLYLQLLRRILGSLFHLFPKSQPMIKLLINNLEYKLKLENGF